MVLGGAMVVYGWCHGGFSGMRFVLGGALVILWGGVVSSDAFGGFGYGSMMVGWWFRVDDGGFRWWGGGFRWWFRVEGF